MNRSRLIHGLRNKKTSVEEDSDESTGSNESGINKLINFHKDQQAKVNIFKYFGKGQDVELPKLRKSVVARAYQDFKSSTPFVGNQKNRLFPFECSLNLSPINTDDDDRIGRIEVDNDRVCIGSPKESLRKSSPERGKFCHKQSSSYKQNLPVESNLHKESSENASFRDKNQKKKGESFKEKSNPDRSGKNCLETAADIKIGDESSSEETLREFSPEREKSSNKQSTSYKQKLVDEPNLNRYKNHTKKGESFKEKSISNGSRKNCLGTRTADHNISENFKIDRKKINNCHISGASFFTEISPERDKSCKPSAKHKQKLAVEKNCYEESSVNTSRNKCQKNEESFEEKNSPYRNRKKCLGIERAENKTDENSEKLHSSRRQINNPKNVNNSARKNNSSAIKDFVCGCSEDKKTERYKHSPDFNRIQLKSNESQNVRITRGTSNRTDNISSIQNVDNINFGEVSESSTSEKSQVICQDVRQGNSSSSSGKKIEIYTNLVLRSANKPVGTNKSKHNINEMTENETHQIKPSDPFDRPHRISPNNKNFRNCTNGEELNSLCSSTSNSRQSEKSQLIDEMDQRIPIVFNKSYSDVKCFFVEKENSTKTITDKATSPMTDEQSEKIHRLNNLIAQLSEKKFDNFNDESESCGKSTDSTSQPRKKQNLRILLNKEIQTSVKKPERYHHVNSVSQKVGSLNKSFSNLLFVSLEEDKSIGFSRDEDLYISNPGTPWRVSADFLPTTILRRSNTLCDPSTRQSTEKPLTRTKYLKQYKNRQKSDDEESFLSDKTLTNANQNETNRSQEIIDKVVSEWHDYTDSDDSVLCKSKYESKVIRDITNSPKEQVKQFKKNAEVKEIDKFREESLDNRKSLKRRSNKSKKEIKTHSRNRCKRILSNSDTESTTSENSEIISRNSVQLQQNYNRTPTKKKCINRGGILQLQNSVHQRSISRQNSDLSNSKSNKNNSDIQKKRDQSVLKMSLNVPNENDKLKLENSEKQSLQSSRSKNLKSVQVLPSNTSVEMERSEVRIIDENEPCTDIFQAEVSHRNVNHSVDSRSVNLQTDQDIRNFNTVLQTHTKKINNSDKKEKSYNHSMNKSQNNILDDKTGNIHANDYTSYREKSVEITSQFSKNHSQKEKSVLENISKVTTSEHLSTNNLVPAKKSTSKDNVSRCTQNVETDADLGNDPVFEQTDALVNADDFLKRNNNQSINTDLETDPVTVSAESGPLYQQNNDNQHKQKNNLELRVLVEKVPIDMGKCVFKIPKTKGRPRKKQNVSQNCSDIDLRSTARPQRLRKPVPPRYGEGYFAFESEKLFNTFASSAIDTKTKGKKWSKKKSGNSRKTKTDNEDASDVGSHHSDVESNITSVEKQTEYVSPPKTSTYKEKEKTFCKRLSFSEDIIQAAELNSQSNTNLNNVSQSNELSNVIENNISVRPLQNVSNSLAASSLVTDHPTHSNFISKDSGRSTFREDTFLKGTKSLDKVKKSYKKNNLNISQKISAVSARIKRNAANGKVLTGSPEAQTEGLELPTEDLESPMTREVRGKWSSLMTSDVQEDEFIDLSINDRPVNLRYFQDSRKFTTIQDNLMVTELLEPVSGIGMSYLQIPPGGRKPLTVSKDYSYTYTVIDGEGQLSIHNRTKKIRAMSRFFVPKDVEYLIMNTSNEEPLLLFFVMTNLS